ncbi:hypothetical protein [Dactylosporangium salmoneum]|uniref:hypothetical protein n=1 Tax=Dactylosporangium salmoneum TaxID=53361 RepID=UPI0031D4389C
MERSAYAFYCVAALGSSIGQIWVGVDVPPWPATVPIWLRVVLVLPFAIVLDLGGAVTSAFADTRQRLGENAYGWRMLSAASVTLAVGINIIGHATSPYLATVFGGLGTFAYTVWLLHSSARRRDALRTADKLRNTAPAYGLPQWWREPAITRRARTLAIEHSLGLHESLTAARTQLAAETRRAALATHIEAKIRARHADDPILASIAATTTSVDDVAQALMDMTDIEGWARSIAADIQPPEPAPAPVRPNEAQPDQSHDLDFDADEDEAKTDAREEDESASDGEQPTGPHAELAKLVPANATTYARWRTLWVVIRERPDVANKQLAEDLEMSVRTVQRIRAVGAAGHLDAPQPLNLLPGSHQWNLHRRN